MTDTRVASVQFQHAPGDKAANFVIVRRFTAEAAEAGVELVVFPEMCLTGYWHLRNQSQADLQALAEPVPAGVVGTCSAE
jgi:predicted amidohydrolase